MAVIISASMVILMMSSVNSRALEEESSAVRTEIDGVIEDFENTLPDGYEGYTDINEATEALGLKRILEGVINVINGKRGELVTFMLTLIGIALLGSLTSFIASDVGIFASRSVGIVSSALLFDRLLFLVRSATESLNGIKDFFSLVIPVCLGVNSLGVSPSTAATQAVGMGITLSIYSYICANLILPLVSAVFVTAAASSTDPVFGKISKAIKSTFVWSMGILTALVGATFSLQSVISAGADNATVRSAKYVIGGTIPIVGGAVSGALGILLGGIGYARSIVGGGAIAVVVSLLISPLLTLLLYRLSLKVGVFFSSVTSPDGVSDIFSSFLGAIDVLIAAYSFTSLVYIVELVAFLKGGVSGA